MPMVGESVVASASSSSLFPHLLIMTLSLTMTLCALYAIESTLGTGSAGTIHTYT